MGEEWLKNIKIIFHEMSMAVRRGVVRRGGGEIRGGPVHLRNNVFTGSEKLTKHPKHPKISLFKKIRG